MRNLSALILCVVLNSCMSSAKHERTVVLVKERPTGAALVGRVSATVEGRGALMHRQTFRKAVNDALGQAEALGASHLVLDKWYNEPRFWGSDQVAKGSAYQLR